MFSCRIGGFSTFVFLVTSKALAAVSGLAESYRLRSMSTENGGNVESTKRTHCCYGRGRNEEGARDRQTQFGKEPNIKDLQVRDHAELVLIEINHTDKGRGTQSKMRKDKRV